MLKLRGKLREKPWPHLYLDTVFEDEVYKDLLGSLPPVERCKPLGGYPNRLVWPLAGKKGLWGDIRDAISSSELTQALCHQLDVKVPAYPKAAICRDLPGYSIKPHVDASFKVMTLIMYLPDDMSQKWQGTRLLEKEGDEIVYAKQLGFFPNVGLAFNPRMPGTWHEVHPVETLRTTLHVCYFDTPERAFK